MDCKERSDAAYVAGFVALASIFCRFALTPVMWQTFRRWQHEPGIFDLNRQDEAIAATLFTLAIPLPGILAPFALWLGWRAWTDLTRNPHKAGAVQAVFALLIGYLGTVILFSEITQVLYHLISRAAGR
jgi:hypothetical protein